MAKNTQVILACIPMPSAAVSTPSALRSLNISTLQHLNISTLQENACNGRRGMISYSVFWVWVDYALESP